MQRPVDDQLLTFKVIESLCKSNLPAITIIVIEKGEMVSVREKLSMRYTKGSTVPGTRSCHHMVPKSEHTIEGKKLSTNTLPLVIHFLMFLSHL